MKEADDFFKADIDPKQLFDDKKYNTLIINKDGMSKKESDIADMLSVLMIPESTREEKDEALKFLKEKDPRDFMVDAIRRTKKNENKALLLAACWETGLDFASHYTFFAEYVAGSDYACAMEALTVLENLENKPERAELEKALEILNQAPQMNQMVRDAIDLTNQTLHDS